MNNKDADQTVMIRRLVCSFVVRMQKSGLLVSMPICCSHTEKLKNLSFKIERKAKIRNPYS